MELTFECDEEKARENLRKHNVSFEEGKTIFMKKAISKHIDSKAEDMRPEYDFANMTGGVRGKYYKAYRAGHTVKIHKADGTIIVQHFKLEDGVVMLESDVREYFPDSEAVNDALRCLIPLMQKGRRTKPKKNLPVRRKQMA